MNVNVTRSAAASPAAAPPPRPAAGAPADAAQPQDTYDYIVVGSGAGGGPLAANLAESGYKVLVLEAGSWADPVDSQVPAEHGKASEDPAVAGAYFPRHYEDLAQQQRDSKFDPVRDGVFYPRGLTVGGSTQVNAMITKRAFDSDWDNMARSLNDPSWSAASMQKYWQRVENCSFHPLLRGLHRLGQTLHIQALQNLGGHGFDGWLTTSQPSPDVLLGPDGLKLAKMIGAATSETLSEQPTLGKKLLSLLQLADPNTRHGPHEGITQMELAVKDGKRNGPRDRLLEVQHEHPDRLKIVSGALAQRVLLDDHNNAVGVDFLQGEHLYRADPQAAASGQPGELHSARATHEVIVSAGAYNTPQLLMLSGIGPKAELEEQGIPVKVDLPGVGQNLQDRYEVGVVSELKDDLKFLKDATFSDDAKNDPHFQDWLKGQGIYTTNGSFITIIKKSDPSLKDPDLYIFGVPGDFHGYYQGYSTDAVKNHNRITWLILKAKAQIKGSVSLKSDDPRDMPRVEFNYFKGPGAAQDLAAVVDGVNTVRRIDSRLPGLIQDELVPGPGAGDVGQWVKDNTWGHHASCTVKIGRPDDPMACLDKDFQVYGTHGLRVVDASAFPEIPGFFIVAPTYQLSEKASDVILEAARRQAH